ncbi:MAG: PEP-CTERM sorting domain-containing protein [Phycisphaerae bacterium]|nr:PEP-CTERM sorting domain-containing protein [Phycisphaerae bacterium]
MSSYTMDRRTSRQQRAFPAGVGTSWRPGRTGLIRAFRLLGLAGAALFLVGSQAMANVITVDEIAPAVFPGNFGTLSQFNVGPNSTTDPGVNQYCAPTATMNSFTFLQNKYPSVYGLDKNGNPILEGGQGSWLAAAQLLAGPNYMNTNQNTGTTDTNWVAGKVNYLNAFAPGKTTFAGMDSAATNPRPAWDQNANPTVNFMLQQLRAGEDIEIGISAPGHVLTLTGLTWNDANNDGVFDAGDTLTLNTIDPANPGANTALTLTPGNPMTISGGAYNGLVVDAALAESPVPEPATIVLFLIGGLALLARRRTAA